MNNILNRVANSAALFLIKGLCESFDHKAPFSILSLKAFAEHLSIFREISKKHPTFRIAIAKHIDNIRDLFASPLFYYFCLNNPMAFRLWGSILADMAYFFPELKEPFKDFISEWNAADLIEIESAFYRRLDGADVYRRHLLINDSTRKIFGNITLDPTMNRVFPLQHINNEFAYLITHLAFYATNWGNEPKLITDSFIGNLKNVVRWSCAIQDADIIAECIVAIGFTKAVTDDVHKLITTVIEHQSPSGSIARVQFMAADTSYENNRHTTLVGLWAVSEYAYSNEITLEFFVGADLTLNHRLELTENDKKRIVQASQIINIYLNVSINDITECERKYAIDIVKNQGEINPFCCDKHFLLKLANNQNTWNQMPPIPEVCTYMICAIVSNTYCPSCLACFTKILSSVNKITNSSPCDSEFRLLTNLTHDFLIVSQQLVTEDDH